jgi:hypothetical protein
VYQQYLQLQLRVSQATLLVFTEQQQVQQLKAGTRAHLGVVLVLPLTQPVQTTTEYERVLTETAKCKRLREQLHRNNEHEQYVVHDAKSCDTQYQHGHCTGLNCIMLRIDASNCFTKRMLARSHSLVMDWSLLPIERMLQTRGHQSTARGEGAIGSATASGCTA